MQNDLTFSGSSPVVINYNGRADDIYSPVGTSSCDINIVSKDILDDIYTAQKDDIYVNVKKLKPLYEEVVEITDPGSVISMRVTPSPSATSYFSIYSRDLFYVDINNDFRFKGVIQNTSGRKVNVNLKFNYSSQVWDEDNYWGLMDDISGVRKEQYFHDGTDSYKVDWDGTSHYISTWVNGGWHDRIPYLKIDGSSTSDMAYGVDEIVHFIDGTIETLHGTVRYGWDRTRKRWFRKTDYVVSGGGVYTNISGSWYHKIKNKDGNLIDAIIVNGLGGNEDCIAYISPAYNEIIKLITLESSYDIDNIFTDDSGYVYCIKNSGELYYWIWENESWVKFATFSGTAVSGSFYFDYEVPGTRNGNSGRYKRIFIKYTNSSNNRTEALALYNFTRPTFTYHREQVGWVIDNQWEGYATPNLYAQDVTQNLDAISITAIDYLSVLKYVTIDKIFTKPSLLTYGEILGQIISYTIPAGEDISILAVENSVSYGGAYDGTNGLLDMRLQVANFWDESGEPSTAYDMIAEMLRPFCLKMTYDPSFGFTVYNANNMSYTARPVSYYIVRADGTVELSTDFGAFRNHLFELGSDWISNNTQDATIEINNTYDKVTGVVSTCIPSYSRMAIDMVDYNQRDLYEVGDLNVQTNKSKGYKKYTRIITLRPGQSHPVTVIEPVTEDKWFYIWNGVYCNGEYDLVSYDGNEQEVPYVSGYDNINKAYEYLSGNTGNPLYHGSVLNFYGGSNNPTATGKDQDPEKAVDISKRITSYAQDNGVPPEFLETSDIGWTFSRTSPSINMLNKVNSSDSKFGTGAAMGYSNKVIYHQMYENIVMSSVEDQIVDINLSHSFSRTGLDVNIDVMSNNTATNKTWFSGGSEILQSCNSDFFPSFWNASNVKVDSFYFRRYSSTGTGGASCRPVWDQRRIDMYVKLSDDTYLQFNGKDWVADDGSHSHPFYLGKMMTYETLYHNDIRYNAIRSSADSSSFGDTAKYSLTDEDIMIYYDSDMGVTEEETSDYSKCTPYKNLGLNWVAGCSEGALSIKLPFIDDPAATVYVDIYNSSMLGMTGADSSVSGSVVDHEVPFYYTTDDSTGATPNFKEVNVYFNFLPANAAHVKAEHLDLSITVSVPESNLGQIFSESDIEYEINSGNNYMEVYEGPSFRVNTYNSLVASSWSYLMFDNTLADPGNFIINNVAGRPECYVVQAYFNWLTNIRKIYTKTILPVNDNMYPGRDRFTVFLSSTEVGGNDLMVISDSIDLKSGRHTVVAIEDYGLQVDYIQPVNVVELPRRARAERYNLPTASRRK